MSILYYLVVNGASLVVPIILFNNLAQQHYPEQHKEALINISYVAVYIYSKCEFYSKKGLKYIKENYIPIVQEYVSQYLPQYVPPHMSNNIMSALIWANIFNSIVEQELEFIKNGKVVYKTPLSSVSNVDNLPAEYDFIIYSDRRHLTDLNCKVNKVIYNTLPTTYDYTVSTCNFCSIEINMDNGADEYIVLSNKFSGSSYNYHIENNVINEAFLHYFIRTHNSSVLSWLVNTRYTLRIMDSNINIIHVPHTSSILFTSESYKIVEQDEEKEEEEDESVSSKKTIDNIQINIVNDASNVPAEMLEAYSRNLSENECFVKAITLSDDSTDSNTSTNKFQMILKKV